MKTAVPAKKSLEIFKPHSGQDPVEPALGEPAAGVLDWMVFRGPFQPQLFCNSLTFIACLEIANIVCFPGEENSDQ